MLTYDLDISATSTPPSNMDLFLIVIQIPDRDQFIARSIKIIVQIFHYIYMCIFFS